MSILDTFYILFKTNAEDAAEDIEDVDKAIAKVAKAQGFSVVMSRQVAAQSGLVVYADEDTDLTQAVIQELKR